MVSERLRGTRRFGADRSGNVAMMWALIGAVLIGLVGLTVDFTRAQMIRAQMQNAVDGAALAAARGDAQTAAQRRAAAQAFYDAEMGALADDATLTIQELPNDEISVGAVAPMPVSLAALVRNEDWNLRVISRAQRSGVNIEMAMVLDVTGSMSGTRISSLRTAATELVNTVVRDQQTPYYSKAALVPYSQGVNVGSYATQARGAIVPARSVTNAVWRAAAAKNITGITRANPAVVTSNGHGLTTGDYVFITGVRGMTQVNDRVYRVTVVNANSFRLDSTNSSGYSSYTNNGTVTRCLNSTCSAVITAASHGFAVNDRVYFTGVGGMTQLNNNLFTVAAVNGNNFTLSGSQGGYSDYTSGGSVYCTRLNCQYYAFTSAANTTRIFPASTCVSERAGAQRYTDASPATAYVGLNYAARQPCPSATIMPLTSDRNALNTRISGLTTGGSTAGHIGLAWGWYMISPNWGSLFPADSRGAAYGARETLKIVVMMTDGAFNTAYCDGVVSRDSTNGSASDHINCDATNGQPFPQASHICDAMKQQGVIIYTVGFGLSSEGQEAQDFMRTCATDESHAYLAENGQELIAAFQAIAASITQLRITH